MRHAVIAIILFFLVIPTVAQHGNEWINFNQLYFKVPVGEDGLYRLSQSSLIAAGLPASTDPKTLRLYHRGVEQAIYVEGESDGMLNASDFIEFYGRKNDGTLDTQLYKTPTDQPHKLYNLYTDTTSYFITSGSGMGKRMALLSESSAGLAAEPFHFDHKVMILKDQFTAGVDYGNTQRTAFDLGEGWTGTQILQNQTSNYIIEGIVNGATSAGKPSVELLLTGRGPMEHAAEIYAGARLVATVNFSGHQSYKHTQTLEWSDVAVDGKITIGIKVIGIGGQPDRLSPGYIILRYPQLLTMNSAAEKIFTLAENAADKSYIEISAPLAGTRLFDITDPSNVARISAVFAATLNAVVPSTALERKIWAGNGVINPVIKRVSFRSINPAAHNFIFITHPSLRKPASGYLDPVKAYAEYRALPHGGGYDTLIVNIGLVYDQFNYGEQSPLGIYNFMKFLSSVSPPDYLFLVGKGLDIDHNYYRNPGAFTAYKDLVPPAGYPPSDMAFTAGLSGITHAPGVPTGRLTAMAPQDVAAYLDKVKEQEARPFDDLRRKTILHLSGGINPSEPEEFRGYLKEFETIAEDFYLGGQVKSVAKQSINIEVINVADEVNKGLNLITFFGHSSPVSTDFDIGDVTDPVMGYNNKGRYPVLLMNGCSAGSFFLNTALFGENWVNTPGRGAIGVIAHSFFGYASTLRRYSELFYETGYSDTVFIHKGLGDIQKEVARRYLNAYGEAEVDISQVQQMMLLGDPSQKLFGAPGPDYEIKEENISIESFTGELITALMDSLKLNLVVQNFGTASKKNFNVRITRTLSDNSIVVYDSAFRPVLYSDTLTFIFPTEKKNGFGTNSFFVEIDAGNMIEELREDNNAVTYEYFIPLSRTQNIYPADFAIVNTTQVNVSLQHTDMLSGEREFLLELDTTALFNSAYRKQFQISGTVLATQVMDLLDADTLAYYWRSRLADPSPDESVDWDVSSFTFIKNGPEGWAQVDYPQFSQNVVQGLVNDPVLRKINFEETSTDIAIKTFGAAAGKPADSVSFRIKGAEYNTYLDIMGCRNNTINLVAFNKETTQPYPGIYLTFYDVFNSFGGRVLICGREPHVINSFRHEELTMFNGADINQYVNNIPAGDSVVLFSIGDAGYSSWPLAAKSKLGELGISVSQVDALLPGEPVIIFARKGLTPGAARIVKSTASPADIQRLEFSGTITGRTTSGVITTALIGPASAWNEFIVQVSEAESTDHVLFDITGVKLNAEETLLIQDIEDDEDISQINAAEYPYLKVSFKPTDEILLTAVQLNKWLVIYEPVAEGLLLYRGPQQQQTLFEGQLWDGDYSFVNISNKTFADSLAVKYEIHNPASFSTTLNTVKIKSPLPGDTTRFTLSFPTVSQDGLNDVEVFVNPRIAFEQNYDNNIIKLSDHINVLSDGMNPLLDVTFDGKHIAHDEFVSPSPQIRILLWDENPYLLKTDTTGVKLLLATCTDDPCDFKPVFFTNPDVTWKAATDTSEFYIQYNPKALADGRYILHVEASDANGNASDTSPYNAVFQVKNETTIVFSSPYPNPFHHKANFEFTVTGETAPQEFSLQIVSLNGKVLHEFATTDVPYLRIGTNTIAWQALDVDGNPLPCGIYIFRLMVRSGDQQLQKTGKIVLVR